MENTTKNDKLIRYLNRIFSRSASKIIKPTDRNERAMLKDAARKASAVVEAKFVKFGVTYTVARYKKLKKMKREIPKELYSRELFRISEIASILGVEMRTVQRHIQEKRLRQKKHHAKIRTEDFSAYLKSELHKHPEYGRIIKKLKPLQKSLFEKESK